MKKEQILKKAIEKAVKGGWKPTDSGKAVGEITHTFLGAWFYDKYGTGLHLDWRGVVFDHDFAKAFWGEKLIEDCTTTEEDGTVTGGTTESEPWKDRLQQMVLEKDPIKYLGKFLK